MAHHDNDVIRRQKTRYWMLLIAFLFAAFWGVVTLIVQPVGFLRWLDIVFAPIWVWLVLFMLMVNSDLTSPEKAVELWKLDFFWKGVQFGITLTIALILGSLISYCNSHFIPDNAIPDALVATRETVLLGLVITACLIGFVLSYIGIDQENEIQTPLINFVLGTSFGTGLIFGIWYGFVLGSGIFPMMIIISATFALVAVMVNKTFFYGNIRERLAGQYFPDTSSTVLDDSKSEASSAKSTSAAT